MREKVLSVSIKDCDVQVFRAGGKGGQAQNKKSTGVRVIHRPSGAVGEARDSRSQHQNKKNAFLRCVKSPEFEKWRRIKVASILGQDAIIEQEVRNWMRPSNLRVEIKEDGRWVDA